MTAISPVVAMLERAVRVVRLTETANGSLKAERDLMAGELAVLTRRLEQREAELAAERSGRADLVEAMIDWLEQGEELVRDGISRVRREPNAPAERADPRDGVPGGLQPGQRARTEVLGDIAEHLGASRERFGAREFARTFGGTEPAGERASDQDVVGKT